MEKLVKKLRLLLILVLIAAIGSPSFAAAFYWDSSSSESVFSLGRINIAIENISQESNILEVNTIQAFSFSIINDGSADVSYSLDIRAYWQHQQLSTTSLSVFPGDLSDDEIYELLYEYDYSNTINLDSGYLKIQESQSYAVKVFFLEDEYVEQDIIAYDAQFINIEIDVSYQLSGTLWNGNNTLEATYLSYIQYSHPVITENEGLNKTFFITQTDDIDLYDYASAFDEIDGDITDNIIITSEPEFDKNKPAKYEITYHAENSMGLNAIPLKITITIWDFARIESGNYHTLALTTHGDVYAWGSNFYGQLGIGDQADNRFPTKVESLSNVVDIATGFYSSFAVTEDGKLYSWGHGNKGKLGNDVNDKPFPTIVNIPERVVDVAAGYESGAAVTESGKVYAWGQGDRGCIGIGMTFDRPTPYHITTLNNIVRVAIDRSSAAAITSDGTLYVWGVGSYGMQGNGSSSGTIYNPHILEYFVENNIKIADISIGQNNMAAISTTGELYTWGNGSEGQIGDGTTDNKVFPYHVSLGDEIALRVKVSINHTGILTESGNMYFLGKNSYGQLGTGTTNSCLTPTLLENYSGITDFSVGALSSLILVNSQEVYGMGYGNTGFFGNGQSVDFKDPTPWVFTPPPPS